MCGVLLQTIIYTIAGELLTAIYAPIFPFPRDFLTIFETCVAVASIRKTRICFYFSRLNVEPVGWLFVFVIYCFSGVN